MKLNTYFLNSLHLIKFAWTFLTANKDLIIFPIVSFVSCCIFLLLSVGGGAAIIPSSVLNHVWGWAVIIAALIIGYFILSFIIYFFNASMYACIMLRLQGQQASLRRGMVMARHHFKPLLGWCLINSSVGIIINFLENTHDTLRDFIVSILGISWSIGAYFVVPILLFEDIGPVAAIKRSYLVFGHGWKKTTAVNLIIGLIFFMMLFGLYSLSQRTHASSWIHAQYAIMGIIICIFFIINSVFAVIVNAGLYLSIVRKRTIPAMDKKVAERAFVRSRPKVTDE